jgi:hypothetical protein
MLAAVSVAGSMALAPSTALAARPSAALPGINYGWSPSMAWGYGVHASSANSGNRCQAVVKVWIRENGKSGVTQLKAKFELRAKYDSGFYGTSYQTRGWFYSGSFPDNATNYYQYFGGRFFFPVGGTYYIRGVLVGIRPGFWRIDRQTSVNLGEVGCELSADDGSDGSGGSGGGGIPQPIGPRS